MAIVNAKVGDFSLGEAFSIGIAKSVSEQLLSRVIGNGTIMSGAIKLGMAWAIPKYLMKNKFGKVVGTALAVDGTEDVVVKLLGKFSAPQSGSGALI